MQPKKRTRPSEPPSLDTAEGFEAAVETCRPQVRALLVSRQHGGADDSFLDDVLQETSLRALRLRESFEPRNDDSLYRWLSSIALNVTRELQRSQGRHGRMSSAPEPAAGSVTQSRAARREERFDRLRDAIEALPPEYREVVMLVKIDGLRVKDVAARLGKTPNAISRMLLRATQRLRDEFGDTESLQLPPRSLGQEDG